MQAKSASHKLLIWWCISTVLKGCRFQIQFFISLTQWVGSVQEITKLMYALWTNMAVASTCRCPVYTFILFVDGCHIYITYEIAEMKARTIPLS
jgi:hypothetical protein